MYKVATFLISHFWGRWAEVSDGLGVLLLTWNQAFYRYGRLDFERLEECIITNVAILEEYRTRDISTLNEEDNDQVKTLFNAFNDALSIKTKKGVIRKSPVSTAKALHLLAPSFFPLWDKEIAKVYGFDYGILPSEQYIRFSYSMKKIKDKVESFYPQDNKTVLKQIDEYNYSKYTKKWII